MALEKEFLDRYIEDFALDFRFCDRVKKGKLILSYLPAADGKYYFSVKDERGRRITDESISFTADELPQIANKFGWEVTERGYTIDKKELPVAS